MPGSYGNQNLNYVDASAYVDYAGSSENVTLPVGTTAVSLIATTKCWVVIGDPGETPVAAPPGAEKTWVRRTLPVSDSGYIDIPVPMSVDGALVKVAVIQDSAAGVLDVMARKED